MRAALRFRKGQALLLALLSAIVTACVVFAPLSVHSIDESLVKARLDERIPAERGLSLDTNWTPDTTQLDWSAMEREVPPELRAAHGAPVRSARTDLSASNEFASVVAKDGACEHLNIEGACPRARGEILVSKKNSTANGWKPGSIITGVESVRGFATGPRKMRVVGAYEAEADDPFWTDVALLAGAPSESLRTVSKTLDSFVTTISSFELPTPPPVDETADPKTYEVGEYGFIAAKLTSKFPVRQDALNVTSLDGLAAVANAFLGKSDDTYPVNISTALPNIAESVTADSEQVRVIVPVLLAQLVVLLLVVLGLMLSGAVDERSRETALARLRGHGRTGARGLVAKELALPLLIGAPLGIPLAYLADWVGRRFWLMPDVSPTFGPTVLAAVLLAIVALAITLWVAVRRVGRASISSMLRGVPERSGQRGVRPVDVVVLTAAAVGVAAMATGAVSGPVALLTPSVLALAAGTLIAMILVPVATWWGRRRLSGGNVSGSFTAAQIARRPSMRRIVVVLTVATALTVFSLDAFSVGQRNRTARADAETGAAMVISPEAVDEASDLLSVQDALNKVDPGSRTTTAVVDIHAPSNNGVQVTAVDPAAFARIMRTGGRDIDLSKISGPSIKPVEHRGRTISLTLQTDRLEAHYPNDPAGRWQAGGERAGEKWTTPRPRLELVVRRDDGVLGRIDLGEVPAQGKTATLTAPSPCALRCTVQDLNVTVPTPDLNKPSAYHPKAEIRGTFSYPKGPPTFLEPADWIGEDGLRLSATSLSFEATMEWSRSAQTKSKAQAVKGLVTEYVRTSKDLSVVSGDKVQSPSLAWEDTSMTILGTVPLIPGTPRNTVVQSLDTALVSGFRIRTPDAAIRILSSDDSPAAEQRITKALAAQGLPVARVTRSEVVKQGYDRSASGWGLQLGLLVAAASLIVALVVMVLSTAMSWRSRTRDLAALRMAGVSTGTLRRAVLAEFATVTLAACALGTVVGAVGGLLAFGQLPLFAVQPQLPIIDRSLPWVLTLVGGLAALIVCLLVALVVVRRIAGGAALARVKESA